MKTHTALHIIKGAVQKVLGARWTAGVYEEGEKGRLTVELDRKPTEEEIASIQSEVDRIIAEAVPIKVIEMERDEAEKRYGDAIYDRFRVPDHIRSLKIVEIKDWNVNCCAKEHTKTTDIGRVEIVKYKFKNSRGQLGISFTLS